MPMLFQYEVSRLNWNEWDPKEWIFDWDEELHRERMTLKISHPTKGVVGLMSMQDANDHVYLTLIERRQSYQEEQMTPFFFAVACLWSVALGYEGYVFLVSKNELIPFYEQFGAVVFRKNQMFIQHDAAKWLIETHAPYLNFDPQNV